jgi:O6-methylguanine-DNA--protein-cysteine methyltransferase
MAIPVGAKANYTEIALQIFRRKAARIAGSG